MDLMSGKTTFAALQKKYNGMSPATMRIQVDGVDIVRKLGCAIDDLEIDLTAGYEASGCTFTVARQYDIEKTQFDPKGAAKYLQVGASVEVEIGYIKTESVFYGYVLDVEYVWGDEGMMISVNCADAKCLLMKSYRMEILKEKKLTQAINSILASKPAASYLKGKKVDQLTLEGEMIRLPMETDYEFLVRYAQYTGCEFFIIQGKAYYRKPPAASSQIMTLSLGKGLLSAEMGMHGGRLVKEVQVAGIDPETGKAVNGKAMVKGKFSKGASASKSMDSTVRAFFDETVTSAQEASNRAKILMADLQKDFMVFHGVCRGIPELIPGRTVKIKGLDPIADKEWYIQNVRHTIDDRGFMTEFAARMDSL